MATLKETVKGISKKKWTVASSAGSIGIIGIVCFLIAAVLLFWKPFLGKFSTLVAFALCLIVVLFDL